MTLLHYLAKTNSTACNYRTPWLLLYKLSTNSQKLITFSRNIYSRLCCYKQQHFYSAERICNSAAPSKPIQLLGLRHCCSLKIGLLMLICYLCISYYHFCTRQNVSLYGTFVGRRTIDGHPIQQLGRRSTTGLL